MAFQQSVGIAFAPAQAGDFASANPRASVLAGAGSLVAGASGVTVGLFAWANSAGLVSNAGSGAPTGFVHRESNASITAWLGTSGNLIQPGREITLHQAGDFWAVTTTTYTKGQKVFASLTTGQIATGAAGATITGFIETKWVVGMPTLNATGAAGELIKISTWIEG